MKIRGRTLVSVSLALGVSVVALYLYSDQVLRRGFSQLEQRDAALSLTRVKDALAGEVSNLDVKMADWSAWDDTYRFIVDRNAGYRRSNLVPATLYSMKINLFALIDAQGEWVYDRLIDFAAGKDEPLPTEWRAFVKAHDELRQHGDEFRHVSGIVRGPDGLMLLSAQPILTSERKGPARGTLIVGRRLDAVAVNRLAQLTHLEVDVRVQPGPSDVVLSAMDESRMKAQAALEDLNGKPAFTVEVQFHRDVQLLGAKTLRHMVSAILLVGLALLGVLVWTLELVVLEPLTSLASNVRELGVAGDVTLRLPPGRSDEIGSLGQSINELLTSLERSEQSMRILLDNAGQGFLTVDREGRVGSQCSKSTQVLFGRHPAGLSVTELFGADGTEMKALLPTLFGAPANFDAAAGTLPSQVSAGERRIDVAYRPILNSAGSAVQQVLIVATDVTELGRMLDDLFPQK